VVAFDYVIELPRYTEQSSVVRQIPRRAHGRAAPAGGSGQLLGRQGSAQAGLGRDEGLTGRAGARVDRVALDALSSYSTYRGEEGVDGTFANKLFSPAMQKAVGAEGRAQPQS
jgi:hypothetical protein